MITAKEAREMKMCGKCKEEKSFENFSKNLQSKDNLSYYCKECVAQYSKIKRIETNGKITLDLPHPLPQSSKLLSDIKGFEDYLGYAIDSDSNIWTCKKRQHGYYGYWIKLVQKKSKRGYYEISLRLNKKSTSFLVHRILAKAFIPNPNNYPCINHINSIRNDNSLINLEWCTHKHNSQHAITFGNLKKGSGVGTSILKEAQVLEIRNKRKLGYKVKDIALSYGVCVGTIEHIIYNKSWLHINS